MELKGTILYSTIAIVLITGLGIGYFAMPSKTNITTTTSDTNFEVSPIFSSNLPRDLINTKSYRVDNTHIIYIWTSSIGGYETVYWTYVVIGK